MQDARSSLYLYGGSYQRYPPDLNVAPLSLWAYYPATLSWSNVSTQGDHIVRATRGASAVHNGVAYYRGGQINNFTVPNWGNTTRDVYLGG